MPSPTDATLARDLRPGGTLIQLTGQDVLIRRQGLVEKFSLDPEDRFGRVFLREVADLGRDGLTSRSEPAHRRASLRLPLRLSVSAKRSTVCVSTLKRGGPAGSRGRASWSSQTRRLSPPTAAMAVPSIFWLSRTAPAAGRARFTPSGAPGIARIQKMKLW